MLKQSGVLANWQCLQNVTIIVCDVLRFISRVPFYRSCETDCDFCFQQTTLTMRETAGGAASVGPTESLKLEDILEMCADYERQIEAEQKQGLLMRRQMEQQRQQNMMAPSPPQISHLRLPGFNTASPTALALPHVLSPSSPLANNQQSWSPNTTTASTPNR